MVFWLRGAKLKKSEAKIMTIDEQTASDKRKYPRFSLKGVHANIMISNPANDTSICLEGSMVDMSYSGIRIKLDAAMPELLPACNVKSSKVKIILTLPSSGMCCTIKGAIRHINTESEVGLHYSDYHKENEVDAFMFECIKHVEAPH
ncbi:MAG: PilZ domain-containing protein [Alteromonas sp.]